MIKSFIYPQSTSLPPHQKNIKKNHTIQIPFPYSKPSPSKNHQDIQTSRSSSPSLTKHPLPIISPKKIQRLKTSYLYPILKLINQQNLKNTNNQSTITTPHTQYPSTPNNPIIQSSNPPTQPNTTQPNIKTRNRLPKKEYQRITHYTSKRLTTKYAQFLELLIQYQSVHEKPKTVSNTAAGTTTQDRQMIWKFLIVTNQILEQ